MNKKILVIPVMLLTFALLSLPVMALPATKIGVTMTVADAKMNPDPESIHLADHNVVHNKGNTTGKVTVHIPDQEDLKGDYFSIWAGTAWWTDFPTPDVEGSNVVRGTVVLTVTDGTNTGTFEGMFHSKSVGLPPVPPFLSYLDTRMVLRGTEDFLGQTLKLSNNGTGFVGCLIIPR